MLSLLKKKSDAAAPAVPAWHPNFRDYEKLPDVKVVRTAFFINAAAIVVVLALGIYVGINEYKLKELRKQIQEADAQIARDKKPSDAQVALYKKFQAEEVKVNDVVPELPSLRVTSLMVRLTGPCATASVPNHANAAVSSTTIANSKPHRPGLEKKRTPLLNAVPSSPSALPRPVKPPSTSERPGSASCSPAT